MRSHEALCIETYEYSLGGKRLELRWPRLSEQFLRIDKWMLAYRGISQAERLPFLWEHPQSEAAGS